MKPKIEIVPQIPHSSSVTSVAFSPDGTRVLSGGADNIKLWDATTGQLIRTFEGHSSSDNSVAFSPDGTRVLSGSEDNTAKLWDAATGALLRTFKGHSSSVTSVAFSPDGARVLSGSVDNTVKLWDATTGALLRTFKNAQQITSVAFSPDGTRVLSGSLDDMRLWDVATGQMLRTFEGRDALGMRDPFPVSSVAFSPDGKHVLSGSWGWTMKLWDAATGQLLRTFEAHYPVKSVAFSPDGARVLSGSGSVGGVLDDAPVDNTLELWDAATGQLIRTFEGDYGNVTSVAFSPDGARVLSAKVDNTVKLWDATTGALLRTFGGHSSSVTSVAFSSDGTRMLSGGWDNTVKLWDATTGALLRTFKGHTEEVSSVAFSPDGARVLSGSGSPGALEHAPVDNTLKLWDATTGQLIRTFKGHTDWIISVAFSPDGARVLSGSGDKTMKLWDATTGALIRTFEGHSSSVSSVAFSPDGTRVLSGSWDETMKLWDAATGQLLRTFEGEDYGDVNSVAFSPDGAHVLSGTGTLPDDAKRRTVRLWDAATGALLRTFEGDYGDVSSVAFSPDGTRVLSGSADNTVQLWDATTGQLIRTFAGHSSSVSSVAFSPDGARVLSGSSDTTVRMWSVQTGELLASLIGERDGEWLAITPKGFFVASPKGSQALSVVRGLESYSVLQFYDHLYRHDLVEQLLKGDPEGKYADAASKLNLEKILDSGSAPQIEQIPERKTELINDTAKVTVRLADTGGGIGEKVVWRVNGVTQGELSASEPQAPTTRGGYRIVTQTLRVDPAKKNVIEITAYNGAGLLATEPYHIEIDKFGVTTEERPRMYVVAVGVSDYAKSEWHLKYAANDAEIMGDTLKSVARGLYGEPKVVSLLDKDATAKGIEAAIDNLQGEVKPADVFVLYVAGHGRNIAGTYYFLPQDLQFEGGETIVSGGISQDMLQKWLAKIPAQKSILILDTCESAAARGGDIEQETAVDRLQHATGRSVITAASSSAFEGYQGHGLLTYTILDELTKPEGGSNEEVTLSKLAAYVYDQVPKLSQRVFGERQQPHSTIADDFPLGERVAAANTATSAIDQVDIPKTPTHVLIRAERVREQPSGTEGERTLTVGTLVRVVEPSQGWALVARDGEKLGYVPEDALAPVQ